MHHRDRNAHSGNYHIAHIIRKTPRPKTFNAVPWILAIIAVMLCLFAHKFAGVI